MPRTTATSTRKRRTPVQRDILWIVEEAGSETVCTVLNTLTSSMPELSEGAFREATAGLFRAGFVELTRDLGTPDLNFVPISVEEAKCLLYNPLPIVIAPPDAHFTWDETRGGGDVSVTLTALGRRTLTE